MGIPICAIVEVLPMPEVIFAAPAGRIEGRYHPARQKNAPIAIVLHPHPQFGGTMNHQIVYQLYYAFAHRNFAVVRFNFRGVGRSQGAFDHGQGELSDAASALDWAQSINPEARSCWIAGFSFGAWIGMQLLMRRPEIEGFISIAPPANLYDFSFLAPCPSSGLIVHGDKDAVVPAKDVSALVEKLKTQKGIVIDQKVIPGANHFFDGKIDALMQGVTVYPDTRLKLARPSAAWGRAAIPPSIGRGAPVVPGKVIGRPVSARTARNANACASIASDAQPRVCAVFTVAGLSPLPSMRMRVALRAPPPAMIHVRGARGNSGTTAATAAAVNAVNVAAPSASENPAASRLAKAWRSSDLGGGAEKNGCASAAVSQASSIRPCAAAAPSRSNGAALRPIMKSSMSALPGPVSQAMRSAPSM